MKGLSNQLFQKFSHLAYQECGIYLHEGKKDLLQARLNKRLRVTGIASYEDYYHYVASPDNANEIIYFLNCISTNLTSFFREPRHFEFLDQVLIPELILARAKAGNRRLRLWSAACSTGEEPYSMAMSVLEHLRGPEAWDFKILATDISTQVLETASRGIYPKDRLKSVPPPFRQRYFQRLNGATAADARFEAAPELKRIVVFRRLNLQAAYPFKGPFDVVFCRNVMIYFDKRTQQELVRRIAEYLAPGGYLFVGHSESLTGLSHSLSYVRPSIYRK